MTPVLTNPVVAPGFKPGALALRIRRGNSFYLLPRAWVRGMRELGAGGCYPLPRTKRWVLGLVEQGGRPLPLLDPAACQDGAEAPPVAAVLFGAPEREPLALIGADEAGRFVSIPGAARCEPASDWLSRVHGGMKSTWWVEARRLAETLEG
ncbi:MAG: hypothetical protein QM691_17155 [Opitutaceae bacterium]